MKVFILDSATNRNVLAQITEAEKSELPKKNEGWSFGWKKLYEKEALVYKLSFENEVQGLLKLKRIEDSFYEMTNLELKSSNLGSKGRYHKIAGCLIAFACLKSFELNKGNYEGFLSFTSKGELIKHYEKNYYAELVFKEKMIITPNNGRKLIEEYLNIEL